MRIIFGLLSVLFILYLLVAALVFVYPFGCGLAIGYYGDTEAPSVCRIFVHKH